MLENLDKENYEIYGVSLNGYDCDDITCDVLANVRGRFFLTGCPQKDRLVKNGERENIKYIYSLEYDRPLFWRVYKNSKLRETSHKNGDGTYYVETSNESGTEEKRIFFSADHQWIRTEYYNSNGYNGGSILLSYGYKDGRRVFIKKSSNQDQPVTLYRCDYYDDPEILERAFMRNVSVDVSVFSTEGLEYYAQAEGVKRFEMLVEDIKKEIAAERAEDFSITPEQATAGFNFKPDYFNNPGGSMNIKNARNYGEPRRNEEVYREYNESMYNKPEDDHGVNFEGGESGFERTKPAEAERTSAGNFRSMPAQYTSEYTANDSGPYYNSDHNTENMAGRTQNYYFDETSGVRDNRSYTVDSDRTDVPGNWNEGSIRMEDHNSHKAAFGTQDHRTEEYETADYIPDEVQYKACLHSEIDTLTNESADDVIDLSSPARAAQRQDKSQRKMRPGEVMNSYNSRRSFKETENTQENNIDVRFFDEDNAYAGSGGNAPVAVNPWKGKCDMTLNLSNEVYRYYGETNSLKERNGYGRTEQPNGRTAYEGEYYKDRRDGFGVHYYKNDGVSYVGSWKNNKRDGMGVGFKPEDGSVLAGRWQENKPSGVCVKFDKEGNVTYYGKYVDGKREGFSVVFREDGVLEIVKWKNDEKSPLVREVDLSELI